MRPPLIDVRDDEALSSALSQVFLFVEQINANAGLEVRKLLEQRFVARQQSPAKLRGEDFVRAVAHVALDFKNLVLQLLQWLACGGRWSRRSVLLTLAREVGLQPKIDPRILEELVAVLVRPARLVPVEGEVNWKIKGTVTSLPRAAGIDVLFERLWLYESAWGPVLATRPLLDRRCSAIPEIPVYFWEEPFDPIGIVRLFISEVLGETGRAADHYLQRWLRSTFYLAHYDKHHKYSLAAVRERFNRLFYESAVPPTQLVHNYRTATVSVSLLVSELAEAMLRSDERAGHTEPGQPYLRQSLGLYLFLHFCRQVRRRTFWPDLEEAREHGLPEESLRELAAVSGEQCISSLRPLGYTYFQSRIFGVISPIPGLSNVFRGGLLPRTDSGRAIALLGPAGIGKTVLALQLMADFARFGGLAIYLSFEESYDSILDRLVTFGLWDRSKLQVRQAGENLSQVVKEAQLREPEKGLLIFYQPGKGASSTLPQVIASLGAGTQDWPGHKALAIDSVNSLQFPPGPHPDGAEDSRSYLYDAIAKIEEHKFFGVLLGEKDGRFYRILPYLADTVIELGFDEEAHTRWFEIKKCRVQDYHEGKHPFRMLDGRGIIIYPSLAARRSSLRGRIRSTLSQRRVIPYPGAVPGFTGIPEKSSTVIWGPQGSGKTLIALKLLTAASTLKGRGTEPEPHADLWPPQNIMVISFRTSEKNFVQALERQREVAANWCRIPQRWLRWYSPGSNLTAEQILSEIWRHFNESRRKGVPVDRIVFDEIEVAQDVLPALRRDSLFWPTVLDLTSTEAATSFFICGSRTEESSVMKILQGSMDNALHIYESRENGKWLRCVDLVQHTELVPGRRRIAVEEVRFAEESPAVDGSPETREAEPPWAEPSAPAPAAEPWPDDRVAGITG